MNSAPGNAQRLPGMDLDWLSVDRPGQHSLHPVDRLFIMVVAMSGSHQSGPARHGEFEGGNAACRVVAGDEEVDSEWSQRDQRLGRIDAMLGGLLRHIRSSSDTSSHFAAGNTNSRPYRGAASIILCTSPYAGSSAGGNVIARAGTLNSLNHPSNPAGVTRT